MPFTAESPASPAVTSRTRFDYGWVILLIAACCMTATLPGRTHGLGLITTPLCEDLHIDEVSFGWLNFYTIILGAAFCWPVGRLADRWGSRTMLTFVTAALGLVVVLTTKVISWWSLFIVLVGTRGLGQGALSVLSTTLVGKWFTRRVGWAMGVYAILLGIGFIGSVVGMGRARDHFGWRHAWESMGWALLIGLAPLCWLGIRSPPDASSAADEQQAESELVQELEDLTLIDALTSPAFWVFSAASCLFGMAWSAITLYNESVLASQGFGSNAFYLVMAILVGVGMVANMLGGWLATHRPLGQVLGLGMALLAASLIAFPWVRTQLQLILYATTFGIASGLVTVVHFTFHPKTFGRTHLGQIQGVYQIFSVFTSAVGPLTLALCHRWTGSYSGMFHTIGPVALLLAIAVAWTPMPRRIVRQAAMIPQEVSA